MSSSYLDYVEFSPGEAPSPPCMDCAAPSCQAPMELYDRWICPRCSLLDGTPEERASSSQEPQGSCSVPTVGATSDVVAPQAVEAQDAAGGEG